MLRLRINTTNNNVLNNKTTFINGTYGSLTITILNRFTVDL